MLSSLTRILAGTLLALALAGCGMKGDLRLPDPPPADATLAAPPTLPPASAPAPQPASQP
ncbi:MAG: lipoprotein [Castellaniella sp.]|uniref:LPS translocon maturation chaperone LptM n=1 Tax=Castellaniella sp. TaxID=1955812 RepID=UPI002A372175|nr:lipoprotein [Castellaniella sp.]MDY0310180.1 lipoprotein [Castellaniella sp.]